MPYSIACGKRFRQGDAMEMEAVGFASILCRGMLTFNIAQQFAPLPSTQIRHPPILNLRPSAKASREREPVGVFQIPSHGQA